MADVIRADLGDTLIQIKGSGLREPGNDETEP
jgi:hypothetical protein